MSYFRLVCYLAFCLLYVIQTSAPCFSNTKEELGFFEIPAIFLISLNQTTDQVAKRNAFHLNKSLNASQFTISLDDIHHQEFQLLGAVLTNCPPGKCDISSDLLFEMTSPQLSIDSANREPIDLFFNGKVGNSRISTKKKKLNFTPDRSIRKLPWKANIDIVGKILSDKNQIKLPKGHYVGDMTIKVYVY